MHILKLRSPGSIPGGSTDEPPANARFIGIDIGAETLKLAELLKEGSQLRIGRLEIIEHGKNLAVLADALSDWEWPMAAGAAISGRFASRVSLSRIPTKQAQLAGYRFLFGAQPATVVNIGSQGFSVLELHGDESTRFRENSRCSQGTGNFLRQLVERFSLTVEEAGVLCAKETEPAPLSGRCPVILKTDMTHLANKGENRARILAGLFDAVCENVLLLLKPGSSPPGVLLAGGVSRSPRVRSTFVRCLAERGMHLVAVGEMEALCLEAIGSAVAAAAAEYRATLPSLDQLLLPAPPLKLERLPSLTAAMPQVKRLVAAPRPDINPGKPPLVIGFDVGSTGSKIVAINPSTSEVVWEDYRRTLGDPVGAAQDLLNRFSAGPAGQCPVLAFGATGSGREVTGSLLTSCFGKDAVYVVNEIVAHATGALLFDARVDTIFEIGGQDAKYIRLANGRVIDCAMNEACSAGTGSFIEEQGSKFAGIPDVRDLGRLALAARHGVSLGQHCSVFMAEVIDEAVASGADQGAILSGLYDSIIKNYLNRVKGNRSVGKVIFCQGMPFAADALAAAVARQTGCDVVVPPNPGTVGALGIALLAARELGALRLAPLDVTRFLHARVEHKDTFVCRSTSGCGAPGNRCRIERLRTVVGGARSTFTWGGACALHDKATRKKKLPNLAPDPFRDRARLLQSILQPFLSNRGKPRIAFSEEFMLKGLVPFFAAFFHNVGYDLTPVESAGPDALKRGIQSANAPFCAPMQLFHGVHRALAESGAEWVFVPMVRSLPGVEGQNLSVVCPIVQAGPDLLRGAETTSRSTRTARTLSPVINFGPDGFRSPQFLESCRELARELGCADDVFEEAFATGLVVQDQFEQGCIALGRNALEFCHARGLVPVVVLGRSYTIYNTTLNSNVPAILREQGAVAVPVDCFPLHIETPVFPGMYWGYGQTILRAAHQVRRTSGVYALYCSNYSCGPDSFNLHFTAHVMEGKPFAVIETDGHTGDAGTKTRVEAFLHCVEQDREGRAECPRESAIVVQDGGECPREPANVPICAPPGAPGTPLPYPQERIDTATSLPDFSEIHPDSLRLVELRTATFRQEKVLVPYMGPASEVVVAALRGVGIPIELLQRPDTDTLRLGRRHTSGKECLPFPLTLGSLLQRLEQAGDGERFIYLIPSSNGPCRFGVYNLLARVVLNRLGWRERVRIWSPNDANYFEGLPGGTNILVFAGILAGDLLLQALFDVRPFATEQGKADALYQEFHEELQGRVRAGARHASLPTALLHVSTGRLFGLPELLRRAGAAFARLRGPGTRPVVELTGEIYLRAVDFSNDFLVRKLEDRGLQVRLAPMAEWLSYCSFLGREAQGIGALASRFSATVEHRIEQLVLGAIAPHLHWPSPPSTGQVLEAAASYINAELQGESVLTLGSALHAWRRSQIDAVVSIGPLECMPAKIAEAQFQPALTRENLLSVSLSFDGNPVNAAVLDNFAFEVHARFRRKQAARIAGEPQPVVRVCPA